MASSRAQPRARIPKIELSWGVRSRVRSLPDRLKGPGLSMVVTDCRPAETKQLIDIKNDFFNRLEVCRLLVTVHAEVVSRKNALNHYKYDK